MSQFFIVMGVSGSGKSTVGAKLAAKLGCPFYDGDDFHPEPNITKMAHGRPLNDADRAPWLSRLQQLIQQHAQNGKTAVLACSALKKAYRDQLRQNNPVPFIQFIYLQGDFDLIWSRLQARPNHYMKADMLQSQFDTLEAPSPDKALIISITHSLDQIVAQIISKT